MTISEKLVKLNDIKTDLRSAIQEKGVSVGDSVPFEEYPDKVREISGVGGSGYSIQVLSEDPEMGEVSGGGTASEGMLVTAHAVPNELYTMSGWYEEIDGEENFQSGDYDYQFIVDRDRTLVAKWTDAFVAGRDWFSASVNATNNFGAVVYADGLFVTERITSSGSNVIGYTSTNGKIWNQTFTVPLLSGSLYAMSAYGNGVVVCLSSDSSSGGGFIYTPGSSSAQSITLPSSGWKHLAYGEGYFLAINSSRNVARSTNGRDWSIVYTFASGSYVDLVYVDGKFVAISSGKTVAFSENGGESWTIHSMTLSATGTATPYKITYGNGLYIMAFSDTISKIGYSTDGIYWTITQTGVSSGTVDALAYVNGIYLVLYHYSASSSRLLYSYDGAAWSISSLPDATDKYGYFAYGNGTVVLTGPPKVIAYSSNRGQNV